MEGRKSKRGRGSSNSSHGRVVTRQKWTEVMNEKEEQDRLEAASALSSLMFLPPKSTEEEFRGQGKVNGINRSASSVTYISSPPLSGNPVCAPPGHAQASPRGSGIIVHGAPSKSESPQNSVILAHLQSRISHMLSTKQFSQPAYLVTPSAFLLNQPKSSQAVPPAKSKTLRPPEPLAPGVPSVVLSAEPARAPTQVNTTKTVTKEVATALRHAVSYSKKQDGSHLSSLKSSDGDDVPITSSSTEPANIFHTDSPKRNDNEKHEADLVHKKKDNTDNNLPLKKRRLVGVSDSPDTANIQNVASTSILSTCLSDLSTTAQIENILQIARKYPTMKFGPQATSLISSLNTAKAASASGEGYRPIQFDPRTSLMVLSDVKLALTPDEDGDLPIHIAVVHENVQLVKKFIDIMAMSGKTVDRFNKLQQTPLHLAVLVNKPEIVADLLEAGANPNLMDRNGHTAIHLAITKQHHECLEVIFEHSNHRCELNSRNFEGYPPLHTCVELDDLDSLIVLRKKGADINVQDGKAGRSVIFYATEYNRGDIVDALVKWGVNAELQNYAGVTPLMTAQAAQLDDIINKLQRALEGKFNCDTPQHSQAKKVPIPRIPSKSSLIVSDPTDQLPSDSLSRDSRHCSLSRRTSNSSPIDLSLTRNTDSPMVEVDRMWEQGSDTDSCIKTEPNKPRHEHEPGLRSSVKEKHTQLVAALEGRQLRETTAVALPTVSAASSTDSANSAMNQVDILTSFLNSLGRKIDNLSVADRVCLFKLFLSQSKPMSVSLKTPKTISAKVLQEENKVDRNKQEAVTKADNVKPKSSLEGIGRQEKKIPIDAGEDLSSDFQIKGKVIDQGDDNFRTLDNACQKTDLTKDSAKDETDIDMDVQDSPEMPVLTRAISVNAESDSNDENRPEIITEPHIEKNTTETMNGEIEFKSQVSKDSSSGSLQGSQGFEIPQSPDVRDREVAMETDVRDDEVESSENKMEVDKKSQMDNGKNSGSVDENLVSSQKHVADKIQSDEISEGDNKIQGNNCEDEMETEEEEESEEMPLIIDEGTSHVIEVCGSDVKAGKSQVKTDNIDTDCGRDTDCGSKLSQINTCHPKKFEKGATYTVCKTKNNAFDRTACDTKMEDSQDLSVDPNITDACRSKHVEISAKESQIFSIDQTAEDYKEEDSLKLSNKDENKSPLERGSYVNKSNKNIDECSESTEVQAKRKIEQGTSESADKGSTVPTAERTDKTSSAVEDSKTHTVYLRDGENFKPIRILIDNSEKTSILLQKMFQRNSNTSANPLVNSSLSDKVTGSPKTDQMLDSVTQPAENSLQKDGTYIASATVEGTSMPAAIKNTVQPELVSGKTREGSTNLVADKTRKEHVSDTAGFEMGLNLLSRLKVEKKQQEEMSRAKQLEENKVIRTDNVNTGPGTGKKIKSYIISNTCTLSKGKTEDPKLENLVQRNIAGSNGSPKKPKSENSKLKADSDDSVKTDSNAKNMPNLSHMTSIGNRRVTNPASSRSVVSLSEGTLTRVNPDIKSKLSKALQSPQRKLGQGKPPGGGDKDCVVPNFQGITGSSFTSDVTTSKTVVTESRQQL